MHKTLAGMLVGLGAAAVMGGTALASDGESAKQGPVSAPVPKIHIVQAGESLSSIAEQENLGDWMPLWNANTEIEHPDVIYPEQQLKVPQGQTTERPLPAGAAAPAQVTTPPAKAPVSVDTITRKPTAKVVSYESAGTPDILVRTKMRESNGNYATNTGNGYYGAYQFDLSTWQSVGGTGLPSDASPAEQDMRATMLYNQRGCQPWPNTCF